MKIKNSVVLIFSAFALQFSLSIQAVEETIKCTGPYKDKKVSQTTLFTIAVEYDNLLRKNNGYVGREYQAWVKYLKEEGLALPITLEAKKVNLCGAIFIDANLQNIVLYGFNLQGANLKHANLQGADLSHANLRGANLQNTNIQDAILLQASLQGADLTNANLQGAVLTKANLQESNITDANIRLADMRHANISNATYLPISAPDSDSLADLKGILTVKIRRELHHGKSGPHDKESDIAGLISLRNALKKGGLRNLERQATYRIELEKTAQAPIVERWLKIIFFESTTGYGLYSSRAIVIIFGLIVIFMMIYIPPISATINTKSGIYRVWPSGGKDGEIIKETKYLVVIVMAFYFSVLSAFHLGWRDLNVGTWITRMQPRDYAIKARGWVRTVSGFQSLISVYLLAIWVLTYFGRPFE